MAAKVSYTAAQIAPVNPLTAKIKSYIAGVTITKGQPLYIIAATGRVGLADANGDSATEQFCGVALNGGGAGQAIDALEDGECYGFDLSGLNYGGRVYVSETVGEYYDTVAAVPCPVGKVVALADKDATKVLRVAVDWTSLRA